MSSLHRFCNLSFRNPLDGFLCLLDEFHVKIATSSGGSGGDVLVHSIVVLRTRANALFKAKCYPRLIFKQMPCVASL